MRRGPKAIAPVQLHGMCVEVVHFGRDVGLHQNGGYLQIKDGIDGKHLFFVEVYQIKYNPNKEDDSQDMFITEMGVGDGMVRVKEEMGRIYAIDVLTKTVEMVYSPFDKEKKLIKQHIAKQNSQNSENVGKDKNDDSM